MCAHRSGIRLSTHKAQVFKRGACLICDQVEAALLMRVLLLYRHVFFVVVVFFT